ncbi:MAG: hypothetical protein H6721_33065 [Sandaracinus sp.]|nr:hypothetical protein [Sandaracinus sp.]MCB9620269.1 hypothetical protein [Sandaracinus sp.]MCB9635510.1 hypothetical protein [Sandaracinus sp.]MCB9636964.1 hypothetical protein [Sandaracinus sp.]
MRHEAPLVAEPWADLTEAVEGARIVAIGVARNGKVYAAAGFTNEAPFAERHGCRFARSRFDVPATYHLIAWDGGEVRRVIVRDELVVSYVQPTRQGVLLVGARCVLGRSGPERNAVEYDHTGTVVRRFTLGDGIEDVRTGSDGSVWVSYFDEGVFGNRGWGEGTEPIGADGCVRFDVDGARTWSFSPTEAGTEMIVDCYAMNVASNDEAWLCFYTGFPIVRVARRGCAVWEPGVRGVQALAIDHDRALLVGDYERPDVTRVVHLGDRGRAKVEAPRPLVTPDGAPLIGRPVGIAGTLYVVRGTEVFCVMNW